MGMIADGITDAIARFLTGHDQVAELNTQRRAIEDKAYMLDQSLNAVRAEIVACIEWDDRPVRLFTLPDGRVLKVEREYTHVVVYHVEPLPESRPQAALPRAAQPRDPIAEL